MCSKKSNISQFLIRRSKAFTWRFWEINTWRLQLKNIQVWFVMMNQFVFTFNSKRNPIQNSRRIHTKMQKILHKQSVKNAIQNKSYAEFKKRQYRGPNSFDNYPKQISQLTMNHRKNPHKPTDLPHRCNTEPIVVWYSLEP